MTNGTVHYSNARVYDVTCDDYNYTSRLNPLYPHGDIPVPYENGMTAMSLEAIWQGLKVFENEDVNPYIFNKHKKDEIIRTADKYGALLGYRRGINHLPVYDEVEARRKIYCKTFRWILENKAMDIINKMRELATQQDIIIIDNSTNPDINDTSQPLSIGYLIKAYVEGLPPYEDVYEIKKINHYYCGKEIRVWTTEERVLKPLDTTPKGAYYQLKIEYDFED